MESSNEISQAIYEELRHGPLLVSDLPNAETFSRTALQKSKPTKSLNTEQKLGHLYEDALANLIQTAPELDLVARSVQIFDATGRTLGELDFLVYDHVAKKHIHLELAVKFYLGIQRAGNWHFPGPDARDNWHRKLERMRNHQLRLSQRPEAKMLLAQQFDIDQIETQQLIYGRLFDPIGNSDRPSMDAMSPKAKRGTWFYEKDWDLHFNSNTRLKTVPKQIWPLDLKVANQSLLESSIVDELRHQASSRCVMFAIENSDDPFFLVPNNWPTPN